MTATNSRRVGASARRRARTPRGAVALEFALVLPILVMLLLGVTTMGMAYSHHLALTNAVREGARLGAAVDYSTSAAGWATSVQQRVEQTYFDAGGVSDSEVCVRLLDSNGNQIAGALTASVSGPGCGTAPTAADMPNTPAGTCVVQVWAHQSETVTLGVLPNIPIGIGAKAASFYGRKVGSCSAPA